MTTQVTSATVANGKVAAADTNGAEIVNALASRKPKTVAAKVAFLREIIPAAVATGERAVSMAKQFPNGVEWNLLKRRGEDTGTGDLGDFARISVLAARDARKEWDAFNEWTRANESKPADEKEPAENAPTPVAVYTEKGFKVNPAVLRANVSAHCMAIHAAEFKLDSETLGNLQFQMWRAVQFANNLRVSEMQDNGLDSDPETVIATMCSAATAFGNVISDVQSAQKELRRVIATVEKAWAK